MKPTRYTRFGFAAVTAVLVVCLEILIELDVVVPVPFLLVYASVAISAGLGGAAAGVLAASASIVFIVHASWLGYGPAAVMGSAWWASLAAAISLVIALILGRLRDRAEKLIAELHESQRQLREYGDSLEREVTTQTE